MNEKVFRLLLIFVLLWRPWDSARSGEDIQETKKKSSPIRSIFTSFELGAGQLKGSSGNITDVGGEIKIHYGLNDRWGLLGGIGRSASSGSFETSLYTSFQLGLERSYGHSLIRYEEIQSVGKEEVVKKIDSFTGGLRLEMLVSLYLFNSNVSVVPFNSLGAGLHYDFPSAQEWFYTSGIGYEYLSNSKRKLNSMKLLFGIFF